MLVLEWWRVAARFDAPEMLEIFGQTPNSRSSDKTAENDK